jgi:DNA-binding beta-propeller fold protein YncE
MRQLRLLPVLALAMSTCIGWAQSAPAAGPYKVLKTAKTGGDGGFDYVYADADGRRLYIARTGSTPRVTVFNLDTLEPAGEIAKTAAHGVAVSAKTHHGFASSKPVAMWDTKTMEPIKTIEVQGNPDGIMHDAFNDRVYIFSHSKPNVTAINPADGSIAGTIDLGGAPEQAASDGKGKLYVDLEDTDKIAVIDAKTLTMTGSYDLTGKGGGCAGLAMDTKNHILFAACRNPQNMVILTAEGKILTTLPIGAGTDGATFNQKTMEAFSSQRDGTLTVVKEKSPTDFEVEQTVQTMPSAKTLTLDSKTGHIFLIAAEYSAPPTPPPAGGRGGRGQMVAGSFTILEVGK